MDLILSIAFNPLKKLLLINYLKPSQATRNILRQKPSLLQREPPSKYLILSKLQKTPQGVV